jgi:hypothetical protein
MRPRSALVSTSRPALISKPTTVPSNVSATRSTSCPSWVRPLTFEIRGSYLSRSEDCSVPDPSRHMSGRPSRRLGNELGSAMHSAPAGVEPCDLRFRNEREWVSASHFESHLTCSASVFSSSGLVEHHAVARSRWTSGWTTLVIRRRGRDRMAASGGVVSSEMDRHATVVVVEDGDQLEPRPERIEVLAQCRYAHVVGVLQF